MKVALISLDQHWENKRKNMENLENIFSMFHDNEIDLVVLPEMTLTGFTMNSIYFAEDFNNSETILFFKQLAIKYHVGVIFGIIVKEVNLPSNRLLFINKSGELISSYSKIHPFSPAGELLHYSKGDKVEITDFEKIRIGSSICFDLRFPELFQALSSTADVIVNIANWPSKRLLHWDTLLRARAIENQVYMIGVNRIGVDGIGNEYVRSSVVYDPNGLIVDPFFTNEYVDVYEIDKQIVDSSREQFPVKKDRQIELYKSII